MTAAAHTGEGLTVPARDPDSPLPVPGALLPEAVRMLAAFAGLGAGTLSFGISSTLLASAGSPWSWAGALASAVWGIALTAWAVQRLRFRTPGWSGAVARLVPVSVSVHLVAVAYGLWWVPAPGRNLDLAAMSALALELMLAGSAGWLARKGFTGGPPADAPAAGRLLPALFAAALAVAVITTPGLAATTAGQHAVPHGQHGTPGIQSPPGHGH